MLEDNKDPSRARKNVEDAIQARKDINGFLGLYWYNGPAIVDAVTAANAGSRYKIITFDAEPKTLQALQEGKIDFTVVQKPYQFGYQSVEFLYKAKTEGVDKAKQEMKVPADGIVDTGVELVTPKTLPGFQEADGRAGREVFVSVSMREARLPGARAESPASPAPGLKSGL